MFLHSEVTLLIQDIIVQDQGGQNNINLFINSMIYGTAALRLHSQLFLNNNVYPESNQSNFSH